MGFYEAVFSESGAFFVVILFLEAGMIQCSRLGIHHLFFGTNTAISVLK